MRIACVLANLFEESEFVKPYRAFQDAGHRVTIVGVEAGQRVRGYHREARVLVRIDTSLAEVRPDDFDALFVPGGYSPDNLRLHPEAVRFVAAFFEADKPAFVICHGPQLLIAAGVVKGRRMTAWPTVRENLQEAGAEVVDQPVVVDHNLVTSRWPADIPAFVRESLKLLEQRQHSAA
jgi:protease I